MKIQRISTLDDSLFIDYELLLVYLVFWLFMWAPFLVFVSKYSKVFMWVIFMGF